MSILNRANINMDININDNNSAKSYQLYDEPNGGNKFFNNDALKGIQVKSELSNLFSQNNIDYLQNTIEILFILNTNMLFQDNLMQN